MPGALLIAGPLLAELGLSAGAVALTILVARIVLFAHRFLRRGL